MKPRTKSVYAKCFKRHFEEEFDLKASVLFCLLSDVVSFIVSANVQGLHLFAHIPLFFDPKPKAKIKRSKTSES